MPERAANRAPLVSPVIGSLDIPLATICAVTHLSPRIASPTASVRLPRIAILELQRAGVGLLAGTDFGFPYVFPDDLARELELFVEAGLTPIETLRTATLNPARFLHREHELGTVAPGRIADLVVLGGNPLDNIANVRDVRGVVANGRWLDREQLDKALAPAPTGASSSSQDVTPGH